MIQRCYNPNSTGYSEYGGAGITVCEHLRSNPWHLFQLLGDKPTPAHSIDRFPIRNGDYACGSCLECVRRGAAKNVRWATPYQQSRNKDYNRMFTVNGETKCMQDWANEAGVDPETFANRIRLGKNPFEKVDRTKKLTIGGESRTAKEWSALTGVKRQTIEWRFKHGRDPFTNFVSGVKL